MLVDEKHGLGSTPEVYDLYYKSCKLESVGRPLHVFGISDGCNICLKNPDAAFRVCIIDAYSYCMKQFLEVRGTDTILQVKQKVIELITITKEMKNGDEQFNTNNVVIFHEVRKSKTFTELDCGAYQLNSYKVTPYDKVCYVRHSHVKLTVMGYPDVFTR